MKKTCKNSSQRKSQYEEREVDPKPYPWLRGCKHLVASVRGRKSPFSLVLWPPVYWPHSRSGSVAQYNLNSMVGWRERQTDRNRGREKQTGRDRDGETERERDIETHTHTHRIMIMLGFLGLWAIHSPLPDHPDRARYGFPLMVVGKLNRHWLATPKNSVSPLSQHSS